jgi:hypothetical protein
VFLHGCNTNILLLNVFAELISTHKTATREYVCGETDSYMINSKLRLKRVCSRSNRSRNRMCLKGPPGGKKKDVASRKIRIKQSCVTK